VARFYVEETWRDGGVDVTLFRVEPFPAEHAARMIERGMLKPDDEPVGPVKRGEFTVTEPMAMSPKRVRRAALAWLAEHEGMTEADSVEIQVGTAAALEVLARIEEMVGQ